MTVKNSKEFSTRIFLIIFTIVLLLNAYVFQGLFHAIVFAAILSGSFYPLYNYLNRKLKKQELAAILTTLAIFCSIIAPAIYVTFQLSKESLNLYSSLSQVLTRTEISNFFFGDGLGAQVMISLNKTFSMDIDLHGLQSKVLSFVQMTSGKVLGTLNSWISNTISFFFQFLMMILACYAFFIEGDNLKKFVFKLSPLPDEQEQVILDKFSQMNFVTLVCNGVGGLIQGVLAGIGLWVCDIESVFLWTTIMILLAFIPLFGISLITIPVSLYLLLTGHIGQGVGFLIYSSIIAFYVENFFKPKFIGKRIQINSILLLFYIIAGMGTFGMAGIFYGPILCITFLTMVDLFHQHYRPQLES